MLRGLALILIIFSFLRPAAVFGQVKEKTDSTKLKARADSINSADLKNKLEYTARRFNPRKALLFSAILPGAGQVYNKKYWKLPFVYGGIIGFAAVVNFYNNSYQIYKNQLFAVVNYPDQKLGAVVTLDNLLAASPKQLATSNFTKQQLEDLANNSRRNRDYFVIITGFIYILQMVDAHVDAHLKEFKINPKLQVKLEPRFEQNYFAGNNAGMALVFKF
jgi:hypothetical protein